MKFSPFHYHPRHHPIRRAAAARLRKMHNEARAGFDMRRAVWREQMARRLQAKAMRAESPFAQRMAVGCTETGDLFLNIGRAAKFYRLHWMQVRRSCNQGRAVGRRQLTFVWLDARMRALAAAKRLAEKRYEDRNRTNNHDRTGAEQFQAASRAA